MFSYRHAFHAGNHADVLKHMLLLQLLQHLGQKDAPYMFIDTHAGAGMYALEDKYAQQSGEYEQGIARLWQRHDLPPLAAQYVELIKRFNPGGGLRFYPGSPYCAEKMLREQDKLRLFELHPSDSKILSNNFSRLEKQAEAQGQRPARGKRVIVSKSDGFAGLKALLPPPSRRGLVLIDPPYEDKSDYRKVQLALEDALARFATGIYAVWYPVLRRPESRQLPDRLKRLPANGWLHATLTVGGPTADGFGLRGSGMFVLNPPWTLEPLLREAMPYLARVLAQDAGAGFTLESGSTETVRSGRHGQ